MGPRTRLIAYLLVYKVLLLLVAVASPGPGYDTSTTLLHPERGVARKLVRWDAIYFTQIASRGYSFDQEWAFGWGFTHLIAVTAHCKKNCLFATFIFRMLISQGCGPWSTFNMRLQRLGLG